MDWRVQNVLGVSMETTIESAPREADEAGRDILVSARSAKRLGDQEVVCLFQRRKSLARLERIWLG